MFSATQASQPCQPYWSLPEEAEASSGVWVLRPHGSPRTGQTPKRVSDPCLTNKAPRNAPGFVRENSQWPIFRLDKAASVWTARSSAGADRGDTRNARKEVLASHFHEECNSSIIRLNLISLGCYLCIDAIWVSKKEKEGYLLFWPGKCKDLEIERKVPKTMANRKFTAKMNMRLHLKQFGCPFCCLGQDFFGYKWQKPSWSKYGWKRNVLVAATKKTWGWL